MNSVTRREFGKLVAAAGVSVALARTAAALPLEAAPQALLIRARTALELHRDRVPLRDRVGLADFSQHSREARFHVVDLVDKWTRSYLVAHGKGSDPEHTGWLQSFSNEPGSLASSSGAYSTGSIYDGEHGTAMRLLGLDPANSNAEPRAIVIHGAWYANEDHLVKWGKLGRSDGCFAVAEHRLPEILGLLGPWRLLYADKV